MLVCSGLRIAKCIREIEQVSGRVPHLSEEGVVVESKADAVEEDADETAEAAEQHQHKQKHRPDDVRAETQVAQATEQHQHKQEHGPDDV